MLLPDIDMSTNTNIDNSTGRLGVGQKYQRFSKRFSGPVSRPVSSVPR
ncbi:hypothetical protein BN903_120 [Halorubrum sp. AJ67]|nr:hypothetical protein BN903_120 [Halorubrum sp. AJ67]